MSLRDWHQDNRTRWETRAEEWSARVDWRRAAAEPWNVFEPQERAVLGEPAGRRIAVLGSGDNQVVFALAALGAQVTSVDIAAGQLRVAAARAGELGLDIRFERRDVTALEGFEDDSYDLVYTGGHVAVWLADVAACYREAARILRPGGRLIVNEYHPFRRIWRWSADELEQEYSYFDRGPHSYEVAEDTALCAGPLRCHEFHWTVADLTTAVLDAGLRLTAMQEYGEGQEFWEQSPVGSLPRCLLLVGDKPADTASRRGYSSSSSSSSSSSLSSSE